MFKQSLLPGFPDGADKIGTSLSILTKEDQVTYFVGGDNYFSHPAGDEQSRRFALTSLVRTLIIPPVKSHINPRGNEPDFPE
ncbi:MAG: hypothetical protein HO274_02415 [Ferrovum myxofaciens]|uniref:hypothetical protein n=1 Tax=Ferrovum myxofaciens TaxID=416213 RepID=UPI0023574269|nr:hypothetical protein [Ferrovum myxofaciens]QKE40310.1 MAG: hypothetical protein HO274_02415 [Ferrovum myxofaciens]